MQSTKPLNFRSGTLELEAQYSFKKDKHRSRLVQSIPILARRDAIVFVPSSFQRRTITVYFDTPDMRLRRAGLVVRFRFPFHDPFNRENNFPASISVKSGNDIAIHGFDGCSQELTKRLEIVHAIKSVQQFDPHDWGQLGHEGIRKALVCAVGNSVLSPLFLTDVGRVVADFHIRTGNGIVHHELAVDKCRYYGLRPDQKVYAEPDECDLAILTNQGNPNKSVINGRRLGDDPQFEIEFKSSGSNRRLSPSDIVYAKELLVERIEEKVTRKFHAKESKAEVGYQLCQAHM
jgi:hypothetical protein